MNANNSVQHDKIMRQNNISITLSVYYCNASGNCLREARDGRGGLRGN